MIEARDADGVRLPVADLELEMYRSDSDSNLMLSCVGNDQVPLLWHGSHLVLIAPASVSVANAQRMVCRMKLCACEFELCSISQ